MSETLKTTVFAAVAVALALLAMVTAPKRVTPDALADIGDKFFPEFEDPNAAATLEIVEYDEDTGSAKPFKVTFKDGLWRIPSHHDYPADGKDRLAQTAAGIIDLKKDDFRSDNVADHEACGVIDPLDDAAVSLKGRGRRVTIRGQNDQIMADLVIGKAVPDREGYYFVRLPEQKRVYASKVAAEISSTFADWIERDLLAIERDDIARLRLLDYSIEEATGRVDQRDTVTLSKDGNDWKADRMTETQEVDRNKSRGIVDTLVDLTIVGVRRKPEGLAADLKLGQGLKLSQQTMLSMQSKGFFVAQNGALMSNEGELQVELQDGAMVTLRFGEILYGTGEAVTAGTDASDEEAEGVPGENRYVFITAALSDRLRTPPPAPANTDFATKDEAEWTDEDRTNKALEEAHERWQQEVSFAQQHVQELNERFADWYYVISDASYEKMRVTRADLVKEKDS